MDEVSMKSNDRDKARKKKKPEPPSTAESSELHKVDTGISLSGKREPDESPNLTFEALNLEVPQLQRKISGARAVVSAPVKAFKKLSPGSTKHSRDSPNKEGSPVGNQKREPKRSSDESIDSAAKSPTFTMKKTVHLAEKAATTTTKSLGKLARTTSDIVSEAAKATANCIPHNKKKVKEAQLKKETPEDESIVTTRDFACNESSSKAKEADSVVSIFNIEMGPVLEVLLRDSTVTIGIAVLIAVYPTWTNLTLLWNNQTPLSVALPWMLVAVLTSQELGRRRGFRQARAATSDIAFLDYETISTTEPIPEEIEIAQYEKDYTLLDRLNKTSRIFRFRLPKRIAGEGAEAYKKSRMSALRPRAWTTLGSGPRRNRHAWEKSGYVKVSDSLMNRLLRDKKFSRRRLSKVMSEQALTISSDVAEAHTTMSQMGSLDPSSLAASSLEDIVVEPIFPLRGMDVFMTDGAEQDMAKHPFLIKNGLRDRPTWIVNVLTQWANLVIYLQMPKWLKDWDNIVVQEDDPEDVVALKNFLNGDDDYRNARLKILPCLVDGPMPIRMLAPPKKELTVACALLPVTWKKLPPEKTCDSSMLHPCLEVELDVMGNSAMRSMASILKRYLKSISLDVAVVVEKPDGQTDEEPKACLGMWRFDKIDVQTCPVLPPRVQGENLEMIDVKRASQLVNLSPAEMKEIEVYA